MTTPNLPPRPNMIPEQLKQAIIDQAGNQTTHMTRDQSIQFVVMLAANLERLLNDDARLPWLTATINQHPDGFTLDVRVHPPATNTIQT